jgi:hypothetical protein
MATIDTVITAATARINAYTRLDFQSWVRSGARKWEWSPINERPPTEEEKVNIIRCLNALLRPEGPELPIRTLDSVYGDILPVIAPAAGGAGVAPQPKVLVVDYANLDGFKNDRNFNYDVGSHNFPRYLSPNLPMTFLLNMVIDENYNKLILVVKNDKYPGPDITKLITNRILQTINNGIKTKYYMIETMRSVKERVIAGTLQIRIVQINSFDVDMKLTNDIPKTLRSYDDCTLIHLIRYLNDNGYTNYRFISRDGRLFTDFDNERNILLPYLLKTSTLRAVVNPLVAGDFNLELVESASSVIDTITDPHYTTALTAANIVVYETHRIHTTEEIQALLTAYYFKPEKNRNQRIHPIIDNDSTEMRENFRRDVAQIFMNVTMENLLADGRLLDHYLAFQTSGIVFKQGRFGPINITNLGEILRKVPGGIPKYFGGDFKEKYLKYKQKYLALKDQLK